jgi:hypothetical protein
MHSLCKLPAVGALALMSIGVATPPATAATLAYDFSATPNSLNSSAGAALGYGFEFTVSSTTTLTGLGDFDNGVLSNNGIGDTGDTVYLGSGALPNPGNISSAAITSTLITPSSTPGGAALCGAADCWAFNSLGTSQTLNSGTTYWIITLFGAPNGVFPSGPYPQYSTTAVTTESGITLTASVACYESNSCSTTSTDSFGPNFETLAAAPLPAALPLFAGGLGFVGLLAGRRKRKDTAAIAAA